MIDVREKAARQFSARLTGRGFESWVREGNDTYVVGGQEYMPQDLVVVSAGLRGRATSHMRTRSHASSYALDAGITRSSPSKLQTNTYHPCDSATMCTGSP